MLSRRLLASVYLLLCVLFAPNADAQQPAVRFVTEPVAWQSEEPIAPPQPLANQAGLDAFTLDELQGMALQRHPMLAEARAKVDAARGNWVQVGLYPNPEIAYVGEEIGDNGKAGLQGGFIRQKFITADKLQLDRQVVTQQIFVAEQQLAADRQRVLNDVRVAFYNALIAQRRVEIARQLLRIGNDNVEATRQAVEAMVTSRIDLLEVEVDAEAAKVEYEMAQSQLQAAWRKLAAAVAVSELPPSRLEGEALDALPQFDWETQLARLQTQSPEIAAAANRIEEARWALRRAEAERFANFEIGAGVLKNNGSGNTVATVEISMPLKIYDRNQGGISEAAANYRGATQALQKLELDLQGRLANVFRQYATSRVQALRYANEVLPRADESRQLVQQAFRQGEIDFLQLLTSERTYQRANLVYLDALEKAWRASIEIEGLLLRGADY